MIEKIGDSNSVKSFIQQAREGTLRDRNTNAPISEATAAGILTNLYAQLHRTDGKAIRPDQVAAYLLDYTGLPEQVAREHQAKLEGKLQRGDNTEQIKVLRAVMEQVEIKIAAGELRPTDVEAYIQQKFPVFQYDLKTIQRVFELRYSNLNRFCTESTSFEQLEGFLEVSKARLSPIFTNVETTLALKRLVRDARAGTIGQGSVARALIKGGFIPNKSDNPIFLAVRRLEQTDPQILSTQQRSVVDAQRASVGKVETTSTEAPKFALSLSVFGADNLVVESDPQAGTEVVTLIAPDGANSIKIPLKQLQLAFTTMENTASGIRIGFAQNIDSLLLKYDKNTGQPSLLLIGGKDVQQNNTLYSLAIGGEALTKILDILRPQEQTNEGIQIPNREAVVKGVKSLVDRIRKVAVGRDSKIELSQPEVTTEVSRPGISTLRSPTHYNQDRAGFGKVEYKVKNDEGEEVRAKGVRSVVVDGSGGSLPETVTEADGRSSLIGGKAGKGLEEILQASDLSPAEAIRVAHKKIKDVNDSFSTVMVADIVVQNGKGILRFAGLGDPSVVAYRQDRPFDHRRSELSGAFVNETTDPAERARILADPSHMQIQNLQHNGALIDKLYGEGRKTKTAGMDATLPANGIYLNFGDKTKGDVRPEDFTVDLEQLDADFILIMSDGAQPNAMLATDPRVDLTEDIAAEEVVNPEGAQNMRNQPMYAQEVQFIMTELTAGKIDVKTASERITNSARNTLGDTDDISVMIIDVRQFRKKKP